MYASNSLLIRKEVIALVFILLLRIPNENIKQQQCFNSIPKQKNINDIKILLMFYHLFEPHRKFNMNIVSNKSPLEDVFLNAPYPSNVHITDSYTVVMGRSRSRCNVIQVNSVGRNRKLKKLDKYSCFPVILSSFPKLLLFYLLPY